MLIAINVVAALGAFAFGFIADRIGQKTAIYIRSSSGSVQCSGLFGIFEAGLLSSQRWPASGWDGLSR